MTLFTLPTQRDTNIPPTIKLPPFTPDQEEFLAKIQRASTEYDGSYLVKGRKPPFEGNP